VVLVKLHCKALSRNDVAVASEGQASWQTVEQLAGSPANRMGFFRTEKCEALRVVAMARRSDEPWRSHPSKMKANAKNYGTKGTPAEYERMTLSPIATERLRGPQTGVITGS
jgi:hypothetical protein